MDTVAKEKEPYQEPVLIKHEPLVDITGLITSGGSKYRYEDHGRIVGYDD